MRSQESKVNFSSFIKIRKKEKELLLLVETKAVVTAIGEYPGAGGTEERQN